MAAAETADRANQDAELHRERARVADQKATTLLHTAAVKAEASSAEAKAAQAAATGTAKDLKEKADRATEVASFDANSRATREAIATGNTIRRQTQPDRSDPQAATCFLEGCGLPMASAAPLAEAMVDTRDARALLGSHRPVADESGQMSKTNEARVLPPARSFPFARVS